ncbi:hypothetical protein B5F07_18035 [Lachnoclostridium sp. An169]|uniref:aminoglycoside phosphotransferase family protein n=1 Tax=Lachnoclostridium sp. An169 TaxID=1965569 RepID=UPI000B397270|nr:phosphotransferase [Lachnoclostridium sp. An169]OUP81257.1 hypothetical protein B5F07_18035 [Lachnoclostridium sp. An169]
MNIYKVIQEVKEGWSNDKKFLIDYNGINCLLRVSDVNSYDKKRSQFNLLKNLYDDHKINMPIPVLLEKDEYHTYMIFEWVRGEDARKILTNYSKEEQFVFGQKAGAYLKEIHKIKKTDMVWEEYFNKKIDRKIKQYRECGLVLKEEKYITDYIDANRYLLKGRPVSLQHGDYHIGNFVIDGNDLYVIDFDRMDFGDPWEEFTKIIWCKNVSTRFAYGRIWGYFNGCIPNEFWKLLGLYMAFYIISSVAWASKISKKQVDIMLRQTREILKDFKDFSQSIPDWALKEEKLLKSTNKQ